MILAPGINIMRTPLCGRNFEYFSEDPYLISELAVPLVTGIESADVSACVKHFALNNQETERNWVNVEIEERALREIYLPGFEAVVKRAKTKAVMGAYNLFREQHCCENKELLGGILRDEWGFDGVIVSDKSSHNGSKCTNVIKFLAHIISDFQIKIFIFFLLCLYRLGIYSTSLICLCITSI